MGHDIYGYKTTDKKNEIAYLRRGADDSLNIEIYNALNCHDCYGVVSGNGSEREFTKNELNKALEYLADNEYLERERVFIHCCLANLDEEGKILVDFY